MRERLARAVAIFVVGALLALSVVLAQARNPPRTSESAGDEAVPLEVRPGQDAPPVDTLRARALFDELGCSGCHAVGGTGNPRNPLDGIGSRRTPASIRTWTLGAGAVADSLSGAVLRVKGTYADLDEADLESLVDWLAELKDGD